MIYKLTTNCLICDEVISIETMYWGLNIRICDKCRAAVMKVRAEIESETE